MAMNTIKAIQLSSMEEELKEIMGEIRKITFFMNRPHSASMKHVNEKKLTKLIVRKNILEQKITEGTLLE